MESTMGRATGRVRLPAVLAVLIGLFLMHGAPTGAMGGCHGAMPVTLPASLPAMGDSMGTVEASGHTSPTATDAVYGAVAQPPSGAMCLSTLARDSQVLPLPALVALAAFVFLGGPAAGAGRPGGGFSAGRRGPPSSGRQLLLQVCTART